MMRHVIGLAAAISATVALWAVAPAARADAEADCWQIGDGDRSLQIRGCSDVIRRDPKAAWAFVLRAIAYGQEGEYDRAIADYSALIELRPRDSGYYLDRGHLYLDGKRDYDRALADFNEHVRLDQDQGRSTSSRAFASRGRAYFLKGDADRGIADFRKAFELEPGSLSGSLRSSGFVGYDDYKRVATELSEAIGLRPDEALLYAWRGKIHDTMSIYWGTKRDRAIADFSAAVRLDPSFHWAYAQRATAFRASGNHERAIADLSEAIRLKPDGEYYGQRSESHVASGDYDRAIADVSEVIKLLPKGHVAYYYYELRGNMYRAKGDYDRAIADYDRELALGASTGSAHRADIFSERAKTYFLKGDFHRALADYDEALKSTQFPGSVYVGRAAVYTALGDHERAIADYSRAIADYSKAIELNPKTARYYDGRAWAYLKAGKAAQGLPDAERALQLWPQYPRALNTRGHILEALGRREQAIADFREALRLDHALQASQEALKRLGATP